MLNATRKPTRRKPLLAATVLLVILMGNVGCATKQAPKYSSAWWASQPAPTVQVQYTGSTGQLALASAAPSLGSADALGQAMQMQAAGDFRYASRGSVKEMIAAEDSARTAPVLPAQPQAIDLPITATAAGDLVPVGFE